MGWTDVDTFPATGTGVFINGQSGCAADCWYEVDGVRFAGFAAGVAENTLTGQAAGLDSGNSSR